jgi:UDP:flavonoid glycosyltransferase YjiC (YdhE family)
MIVTAAIAELLAAGVPTVSFVHSFYRTLQDMAASPVDLQLRLNGLSLTKVHTSTALQIVAARADLDPVRGRPAVRHVGVVWQGTPVAAERQRVPRVLVSLSTNAFAGQRGMLQRILDAVATLPVDAIVTTGPAIDQAGLRVPANARLHSWLDHDDVLRTASLVIGHGGHSTAMRALSFGVPVLVLPANPMIDQRAVGDALARAGAGARLPKLASVARIADAARRLLDDPDVARAASQLGEDIRRQDGADLAAAAIEEVIRARAAA